jgi:hypothetical protein
MRAMGTGSALQEEGWGDQRFGSLNHAALCTLLVVTGFLIA